MKRLLALLSVIVLLCACVSGDEYLNSLSFLRRWNTSDAVKDDKEKRLVEDDIWVYRDGDYLKYSAWFNGEEQLLTLVCDPKSDFLLYCTITGKAEDGKLSKGNEEEFYSIVRLMIYVMCGLDEGNCRELLERGGFNAPQAAHYYEQDYFAHSMFTDELGVSYRIKNLRLLPKELPEWTLSTTAATP
ncbi:MAG: hypothetical protein LBQ80_02755 [Clostridium sp.]|jgi:hypothetical protein|nr:hypothetical protein [Clostridium sp.]